jgi:hypothetical protein
VFLGIAWFVATIAIVGVALARVVRRLRPLTHRIETIGDDS